MKPVSEKRFWQLTLGGLALATLLVGWSVNQYYLEQRIERVSERLLLLMTDAAVARILLEQHAALLAQPEPLLGKHR